MEDIMGFLFANPSHSYYLYSTGTDMKPGYYETRKEAEAEMNYYCIRHGITVECTEQDRHQRKYSNHKGVRFYINRV